ncbi:MAG: AtpZ/AtpI family protein [Bacteroidia bacterium]|nr:AtpZ/AtpI family protein [Bacteroidia bacterium]
MELEDQKISQKKKQLNSFGRYSSMAIQMMVIIAGGSLGGLQLDKWTDTKFPYFTLSLSVISVALAVYFAIKDVIKLNK